MLFDVHLCEGTNITNTHNLHGEVPEEVNDIERFVANSEAEQEGRHHGTQQLLKDIHLQKKDAAFRHKNATTGQERSAYMNHHHLQGKIYTRPAKAFRHENAITGQERFVIINTS